MEASLRQLSLHISLMPEVFVRRRRRSNAVFKKTVGRCPLPVPSPLRLQIKLAHLKERDVPKAGIPISLLKEWLLMKHSSLLLIALLSVFFMISGVKTGSASLVGPDENGVYRPTAVSFYRYSHTL